MTAFGLGHVHATSAVVSIIAIRLPVPTAWSLENWLILQQCWLI